MSYKKAGCNPPMAAPGWVVKMQTLLGAVVDDNGALVQLGANTIDSDQSL